MSATGEAETASEKPSGENFNDEMKDYAKSTMNELLGMFGYEEAITREAVEELQIRLLPEEDDENIQPTSETLDKPMETDKDEPVAVSLNAGEAPVVVPIAGEENDANPSVLSVPVSNNGVIPVSTTAQPLSVVSASPSGTSSGVKPGTALDGSITNEVHGEVEDDSKLGQSVAGVCVTYTSPPSKTPVQKVGLCKWCKKSGVLQNFSSSDGEKEISCKGLCSALCFEQAIKNIRESQLHIHETQQVLQSRPLPPKPAVSKKPVPSAPITRSSTRGSTASGKAKDDTVTPSKIPPVLVPRGLFSWEEYLVKTNSVAAPWTYFRQSSTPPYNGFQSNMKLEVADPRIVDTMCVATVVGILGPRIRCRFDGTDSANDVWHLVDSKEIHPVGWCEGNGGRLQPPVGFKLDPGKYSTFLAKTLTSAELAPVRLFKREPTAPKENMFKVGMKLEALDPKNPLLICVATVADKDGDKIRVDFDGYLGSDYWCRYDSRDIFPVGWCHYSGHPLQPPGNTKKALKQLSGKVKEKADKLEKPVKPPKPARPEKLEKQDKKKTPLIPPTQPVVTNPVPTPVVTTPSSSRRSDSPCSSGTDPDDSVTNHTVQVFINHACEAGPHLSSAKVAGLPTCFRGTVLNVARDCIQSVVNAAVDPEVVFGFLKPGNGKTRISAKSGKRTLSCTLQNIDRVAIFWRVLEKFSDNLQCCENLFCGERITGPCSKCGKSASRRNTVLPETTTVAAKKSTAGSLKRGPYRAHDEQQHVAKHPRITIDDDDASQSPQVCSTSPPKTWSVVEVVKFIEKSELAEHADMFRKHEIDGKALLLLTREMIMSYMGLKLGPAIKLLCFVEELKTKKSS
ncbi:sex comb on midleg-like protein 2 isoform X1 [Orbicella faveolata]|uniref:sex comb on midleg-like protein 2 isoform X1 n=1 Tax=Orbicella faveolata TaxID=48498 RepID=UPI0009E31268|nr:sex comb on midleg-like protein 2 isoform X1 [Orbicella faveolata]